MKLVPRAYGDLSAVKDEMLDRMIVELVTSHDQEGLGEIYAEKEYRRLKAEKAA